MRDCSAQLDDAIKRESSTLCLLWRVTRSDDEVLTFTDATRPYVDNDGATWRSDVTFSWSAIFTSRTMANRQSVTMTALMDELGFREDDLRARLYDDARGEIFLADYGQPEAGSMQLFHGRFGRIRIADKHVVQIEIVPDGAATRSPVGGDVYQATCRHTWADSGCGLNRDGLKVPFTVDVVNNAQEFDCISDPAKPQDWFAMGFVEWRTGENAGRVSQIMQSQDSTIKLVAVPPSALAVGDEGDAFPGDDKTITTCSAKFGNILNFDGEPYVPTQDVLGWYSAMRGIG